MAGLTHPQSPWEQKTTNSHFFFMIFLDNRLYPGHGRFLARCLRSRGTTYFLLAGFLLVKTVRNSTRPFVFLLQILLFFSNGASLFAGSICRPEFSTVESPDIFPKDVVARDPVRPIAEDNTSEGRSSACAEVTPKERDDATRLDESQQLLGKSFNGPLDKLSCGAEANGLEGEDGSRPATPEPSAPSEKGETTAAGIAPNVGPKDQQIGLFACSAAPTPEGEERFIFHNVRLVSDLPVAGLFRPPRERF